MKLKHQTVHGDFVVTEEFQVVWWAVPIALFLLALDKLLNVAAYIVLAPAFVAIKFSGETEGWKFWTASALSLGAMYVAVSSFVILVFM